MSGNRTLRYLALTLILNSYSLDIKQKSDSDCESESDFCHRHMRPRSLFRPTDTSSTSRIYGGGEGGKTEMRGAGERMHGEREGGEEGQEIK